MQYLKDSTKVALVQGQRKVDYHHLIHAAQVFGGKNPGGAGDRVAVLLENCPEWVFAFYGAWHRHQVPVPIDFMSTPEEIAFILDDCRPVALWCSATTREKAQEAVRLVTKCSPAVLEVGEIALPEVPEGALDFGENGDEELSAIIYTSGTTGTPKGVMQTFGNLYANMHSVSVDVPIYRSDDRVLIVLPLHHCYPLAGTLTMPLFLNATCVMTEKLAAESIMAAMQENHVTMVVGVPRLFTLFRDAIMKKIHASVAARALFWLCSKIRSVKFSRIIFKKVQQAFGGAIRYMPSGGAALDAQVSRDFYTLGFEILEGYGMTETAPMISFTRPGGPKPGIPGQPIPCNEVRIQDGEVVVRGKNVTQGYFERPEETAAILDKDGWLHTGDLGFLDEDGYIHLTGRKKEIIVLGNGKNINPEEIEMKVMASAKGLLAECAVIASGEALQLLVVPEMKTIQARRILNIEETILDEVVEPYNVHAPSYKRLLKCAMLSEPLPRTRLGKLRRHKLAQLVQENARRKAGAGAPPEPDSAEYRLIKEYLTETTGQPVFPDDHFELDLSLDSLGKVAFLAYLSDACRIPLPEELLADYPSPRKLAEYLAANRTGELREGALRTVNWHELLREDNGCELPTPGWSQGHAHGLSSAFLHCFCGYSCRGLETLPPRPYILAPNHQSYLDALFLTGCLDNETLKNTYFYATVKHLDGFFAKRFAASHNIIHMDLNGDIRTSLQTLAAALHRGKNVAIFPEGTRSIDGSLGTLKPAFAILAKELDVPIVPVAIDGAYEVLPRNRRFPRFFHHVDVTFLPPIQPTPEDTPDALVAKTTDALRNALAAKQA